MKFWRFLRSLSKSGHVTKSPVSRVETPAQMKGTVPPEVQYLCEDSIVRMLPLSSFVVMHPQKGE